MPEQTSFFDVSDSVPKGATINSVRDTKRLQAQLKRVRDFVVGQR